MTGFLAIALTWVLVLGAGWWLVRPVSVAWRVVFLGLVCVLLLAMTMPPQVIRVFQGLVALAIPPLRSVEPGPGSSLAVHVVLFAMVAWLTAYVRKDLPVGHWLPGLLVVAVGLEGTQWFVEGRYASWVDVGANLAGTAAGLAGYWVVRWGR